MWKNYWNIARIARDPLIQRCVDGVDIFRGIFDFREASLFCARVMSQSLYHKIMYSLSAIYDHRIQSNSLLLVKLHCFSHLLSLWKSPSNWSKKMPTMVSFQKNIKKYQRVLGYMFLIIMVLITHLKKCPCARELVLCIQRQSSFERSTEIDRDTWWTIDLLDIQKHASSILKNCVTSQQSICIPMFPHFL